MRWVVSSLAVSGDTVFRFEAVALPSLAIAAAGIEVLQGNFGGVFFRIVDIFAIVPESS